MHDGLRQMMDVEAAFVERFDGLPTHVVRAPGRVNLIGEHTDYNDLPVFPMAIQREARIALRPREDGWVVLHSADPAFPTVEFELRPGLEPEVPGHWGNYVRAPANELARRFAIWRGLEGVIASDVPVAAGLASSSAIVMVVGVALAHLNEVPVEERPFAELMAEAERFTGTQVGGMDQAVSLAARAGCAAKLTFTPLRIHHVPLPHDWSFVVADSGVRVEKSGPAQKTYNLRRSECESALARVVEEVVSNKLARTTPTGYPDLLRLLGHERALELGEEVLDKSLLRRFRHVVTEARRVDEAVDRLQSADLTGFGTLMDASHGSLRTDFLMSSRELDELTAIAREGGAVGARLTGAGLGGCIVALCDRQSLATVLDTLTEEYYGPRKLADNLQARAFEAVASAGASVRTL